jgi:hypothetical protein
MGKPNGRRPLGRARCRWANIVKMDFGETGWGMWAGCIARALLNAVINFWVP